MPSKFKKLVRDRMALTGESYEQAARHIRALAEKTAASDVVAAISPLFERDPLHFDESGTWYPLQRDGRWLNEDDWRVILDALPSREEGTRSLDLLRRIFTESWSSRVAGNTGGAVHPVSGAAISPNSRYKLLEAAAMLARLPELSSFPKRLLLAQEYHSTCAELRAGLMLTMAGAQIERPFSKGKAPDWLAKWGGPSLGVEVKRLRQTSAASHRSEVDMAIVFYLVQKVPALHSEFEGTVWINFHPNETVYGARTISGQIDLDAVHRHADLMFSRAQEVLSANPDDGVYGAEAAGSFTFRRGPRGERRVQIAVHDNAGDDDHESRRVGDVLQRAASQLSTVDAPGLVVLDIDGDLTVLNQLGAQFGSLHDEPWARSLAGVVAISQEFVATDGRTVGPQNIVRVLPGPQTNALIPLIDGLRECDRGHLHFDPFFPAVDPCPITWR